MSTIRHNRISTTSKHNKVVGVLELDLEALEREYSDDSLLSVASIATSASAKAERRKIRRTEGCFITKQTGYFLENSHWVNAVRKNMTLKSEVETWLHQLGIVFYGFSLNAASNLTPLDRNLHYTLDKLGFCAVTCSKATLEAMIRLVDQENEEWQKREGDYLRYFRRDQPPFSDARYELVALHPHHFLQKGSGLMVYTEQGNILTGQLYVVSQDGALREGIDNDSPRLPAFPGPQGRQGRDILNPFLVVINAEMAFRRFQRKPRPLCAEYVELMDLTMKLAEKMYFKPLVDAINARNARAARDLAKRAKNADDSNADGSDTGAAIKRKKTITRKGIRRSRTGGGPVKRPGPEASPSEVIRYYRYLASGCDYSDDSDDDDSDDDEDDADNSIDDENNNENPDDNLQSNHNGNDLLIDTLPETGISEKVQQWQVNVQEYDKSWSTPDSIPIRQNY